MNDLVRIPVQIDYKTSIKMIKIFSKSILLTTICSFDFVHGKLFFLFIIKEAVGIPIPSLN